MPSSRLTAAVYLVLVFLSGALVGGFAHRIIFMSPPVKAAPRTPEEWRNRYVSELQARVHLDAQQLASLQQILDGTKLKFDGLRQQFKPMHDQEHAAAQALQAEQTDKIRAMLRDDQRTAYEQFRMEREKRRQENERKQHR